MIKNEAADNRVNAGLAAFALAGLLCLAAIPALGQPAPGEINISKLILMYMNSKNPSSMLSWDAGSGPGTPIVLNRSFCPGEEHIEAILLESARSWGLDD